MNAEIFAALAQLEKERGIPQSYMIEKITQALVAAYKKDKDGYTDNVFVEVKDDDMHMYVQKEVVDDVITPATEITLDAARKISKTAQLGDLVNVDVQTKAFGRIAAQTAKQVIIQGIREAERGMVFESFSSKEHEILTGTVLRIEPGSGVGNHRLGLTEETLGVKVIAVGVPMVVYASTIARDAMARLIDEYGLLARGHEEAAQQLLRQVSEGFLGDMVVTPREIDELVLHVAALLSDGINQALQPDIDPDTLHTYIQG